MSLLAEVRLRRGALELDVSLRVGDGEVVAVLGPNGSGKSTLLRALAGLEPLGRGRVRLGDDVLEDVEGGVRIPASRRSAGVLFQDALLFPHLTAAGNVAFGPRARRASRAEADRRARRWLADVGLETVADDLPDRLSGGQAQRVALARALATEPRWLLLDEPMAALDVETQFTIRRLLRRHLDGFPGPCVLVTHDPVDALALADRALVIEDGRVVQEGPPDQVMHHPRSTWAARLRGLNLYHGVAEGTRVTVTSGEGTAGQELVTGTSASGPVFVVVDPQAVAVHRERPAGSPRNVRRGTVAELEPRGEHVVVHVGGDLAIAAEITPNAASELGLGPGVEVWVSLKATEVRVYPA